MTPCWAVSARRGTAWSGAAFTCRGAMAATVQGHTRCLTLTLLMALGTLEPSTSSLPEIASVPLLAPRTLSVTNFLSRLRQARSPHTHREKMAFVSRAMAMMRMPGCTSWQKGTTIRKQNRMSAWLGVLRTADIQAAKSSGVRITADAMSTLPLQSPTATALTGTIAGSKTHKALLLRHHRLATQVIGCFREVAHRAQAGISRAQIRMAGQLARLVMLGTQVILERHRAQFAP